MTTAAPTVPAGVVARSVRWRRARFGLLAVVFAVLGCGVFVADWPSTLSDLEAGIDAGRVEEVRVAGALPSDAQGSAAVTLVWHDGVRTRYASVVQVSDPSRVTPGAHPGREQVIGSVEGRIRALNGPVRITRVDHGVAGPGIGGWRFPGWFAVALLLAWAAVLVLVAYGPEPWWATRAAWTWGLLSPAALVVAPLFLLLSAPPPGVTTAGGTGRRLRGGLAFVLVWLLGPGLVHLLAD